MIKKKWVFFLLAITILQADVFPIQFSIPEEKIVAEIPEKTRDFALLIPGKLETYVYQNETDYYEGYREAYFALTCKKGGWDCLRHYEILANGCIPYFVDLEFCGSQTLPFLPKELIIKAMHLDGVSYLKIDHTKFDRDQYEEILKEIFQYTKEHLTTRKMAEYVLQTAGYSPGKNILYLSHYGLEDYLTSLILIGLKEALGEKVIDVPKIEHIYKGYPYAQNLYGKGMSYTQIVEDLPVDRSNLEERIRNREFDLVIYGSLHKAALSQEGLLFYDLVQEYYEPEKIVYLCGNDAHSCPYKTYIQSSPLFIRELSEE